MQGGTRSASAGAYGPLQGVALLFASALKICCNTGMGAGADPRMNFKRLSSQTQVCVCVSVCVCVCVCVCVWNETHRRRTKRR